MFHCYFVHDNYFRVFHQMFRMQVSTTDSNGWVVVCFVLLGPAPTRHFLTDIHYPARFAREPIQSRESF